MNRMVTKGYRKGVYERVTKGIRGQKVYRGAGNTFNALFFPARPL